jgi:hypothetical protein
MGAPLQPKDLSEMSPTAPRFARCCNSSLAKALPELAKHKGPVVCVQSTSGDDLDAVAKFANDMQLVCRRLRPEMSKEVTAHYTETKRSPPNCSQREEAPY